MIISSSQPKKILLIRTDRIGDVVLSLPMLSELRKWFPDAKISIMVMKYTEEIVRDHSCVDEVLLWESNGKRSFFEYIKLLRAKKFDVVILPYPRFNLALISYLSRIPVRIGTGYRWYSFLFNKKVFEHRKDAKHHETEYNLNLLTALGINEPKKIQFEFNIPYTIQKNIDELLAKEKIDKFVVLHAGSGGSARDWPLKNFSELGDAIQNDLKYHIVLTGSESEKDIVKEVESKMLNKAINFCGRFSLKELGALFVRSSAFVSNSTGPLHIASAVGTAVVAFYPPITQCSAVRWGPYTQRKKIFSADNKKCELCNGGPCQSNVCMAQISVDEVFESICELINE